MKNKAKPIVTALACVAMLSACTSQWDMQGVDPKDYYAAHPVQNKVETRSLTISLQFEHGAERLSSTEIDYLRTALRGISPEAAEVLDVELGPQSVKNTARKQHLSRLARALGFQHAALRFSPGNELMEEEVRVTLKYAAVVLPDCPDWRVSPVTTYSNTKGPNFACAFETNTGLMVADPHDLVRGSGHVRPDSERNAIVIQQYRGAPASTGGAAASGTGSGSSSSGSASGSSSGSSTSAAPTIQ